MPTTTDVRVNDLIINKMTQEQYDALQDKSPTELYVVEGDSNVVYAEQAVELPTASESNLGRIYQYIGVTDANYTNGYFYQNQSEDLSDLTIEQTVGSSLSNLTIDLDTFIETEQPTQDETITFVRVGGGDISVSPTTGTNHGITATITDAELFWNQVQYDFAQWGTSDPLLYVNVEYGASNWDKIKLQLHTANSTYNYAWYTRSEAEAFGVSVTGTLEGSYSYFAVISNIQAHESGHEHWEKDNVEVDPANYGISYEGTPEINDELTVTYIHSSISYKWNQVNVQPAVDPLPSQSGNAGKVLTTNGTDASWSNTINTVNVPDGQWTQIFSITAANTAGNVFTRIPMLVNSYVGNTVRIPCYFYMYGVNPLASNASIGTYLNRWDYIYVNRIAGSTGYGIKVPAASTTTYTMVIADFTNATQGQVLQLDSNNNAVWADVDSLPDQTGQAGKFLTTDGTTAAWETSTTITFRTWGANE